MILGSSLGVSSQKNFICDAQEYSSGPCILFFIIWSNISSYSNCWSKRASYFWIVFADFNWVFDKSITYDRESLRFLFLMSSAVSFLMTFLNWAKESGFYCWFSIDIEVYWLKSTRLIASRCWILYCYTRLLMLFYTALYLQFLRARRFSYETVSVTWNKIC